MEGHTAGFTYPSFWCRYDSAGNIWVASGGDDHVYLFDSAGNFGGGFRGGGIDGPWAITLDGDDNLWVANFGPLEPGSNFQGRLTQLAGINATNHRIGDGLTPQTGYIAAIGRLPRHPPQRRPALRLRQTTLPYPHDAHDRRQHRRRRQRLDLQQLETRLSTTTQSAATREGTGC
jgi:hypothetical protein